MDYIISSGIGYLLGSISPSYIISRIKKTDIRKTGTKNLGASNTFIHFGRFWGIFVMLFDFLKAYFAVKLCKHLFASSVAGVFAGSCAVVGHNYPFYLKFKGGKGLAALGGTVLAVNPVHFLILLPLCLTVAIIFNYSCFLPLTATLALPFVYGLYFKSFAVFALTAIVCAGVFIKFTDNLKKIKRGEESKFRDFIKKYIFK